MRDHDVLGNVPISAVDPSRGGPVYQVSLWPLLHLSRAKCHIHINLYLGALAVEMRKRKQQSQAQDAHQEPAPPGKAAQRARTPNQASQDDSPDDGKKKFWSGTTEKVFLETAGPKMVHVQGKPKDMDHIVAAIAQETNKAVAELHKKTAAELLKAGEDPQRVASLRQILADLERWPKNGITGAQVFNKLDNNKKKVRD